MSQPSSIAVVSARVALVVGSTLFGVLLADLALGFYEPPRLLGKRQLLPKAQPFGFHCYPSNPNQELSTAPTPQANWRLFDVTVPPTPVPIERLSETPYCVKYQLSEQGLRDQVFAPRPATGTVRILGIGDSFAIGEGVPQKRSLFPQLSARLGPGVEVMNAGKSGYGTAHELRLVRRLVPRFQPHRVLVVWLINDIGLSKALREEQRWINDLINVREAQLWRGDARPWWHRSRLLRFVDAWWRMRGITARTIEGYRAAWNPERNGPQIERFAAQLRAMAAVKDGSLALVLYPLLTRLDDYPFRDAHALVARIAGNAGIPVLDLAPVFAGMNASALHVHPTDHHPNGKAHAIAADAVAQWLRSLPGYLSR